MKKWLLILVVFLVSCTSRNNNLTHDDIKIFVDGSAEKGAVIENEVYIPMATLDAFDVDILKDPSSETYYLAKIVDENKVSNDRSYNWYIDQSKTGPHANDNCGPSATVMAAMWQDKNYDETVEAARNEFRSSGGWWYTDDIEDYFKKHNIEYAVDEYDGDYELVSTLNDGNIILLCIDTSYISARDITDDYIGRFYEYAGGHFLIVKGYTYINQTLYFEVYDSNGWEETYSDGSPKGKDRLYSAEELTKAIEIWWDYYMIIKNETN